MLFSIRRTLPFLCAGLVPVLAAGCGSGSPVRPTGGTGAVIAGTITNGSGSASTAGLGGSSRMIRSANSPFAGLTVRITGSNRSAVVSSEGSFQITDVPTGNVQLQFTGNNIDVTITLSNVQADQFIQIQVQVDGSSATIVDELREHKVSLCHAEGNGSYHLIDVADSSEPAHRDHGDAEIGEAVPGRPFMIFDATCRPEGPSVEIEKTTNGGDGLEILVGTPITWSYLVTNTGTVTLTSIAVTDSRGVVVSCPSTSLPAGTTGNSMTCTGTGTAAAGPYSNTGTVTAGFTFNGTTSSVTDSDDSSYRGITLEEQEQEGPKVTLCHKTGAGKYVMITVSVSAEPAHLAHGDGYPGLAVPGVPGKSFSATCGVQ